MSYHIFISYPRIADERGHVSDLRGHLERELKTKTGDEELVVFQDRSHLEGGDPWSENWRASSRSHMRFCYCFRLSGLRAGGAARNCNSMLAIAAPRRQSDRSSPCFGMKQNPLMHEPRKRPRYWRRSRLVRLSDGTCSDTRTRATQAITPQSANSLR